MKHPLNTMDQLISKAGKDDELRASLLLNPKRTIEKELGVTLVEGQQIHAHEETDAVTHLVIPPKSKISEKEREEARSGATSLEFLKKTMHDPAPPIRASAPPRATAKALTPKALAKACRDCIRRGLEFLETTIDENGAWHCIRFNLADETIPRHYERPAFISAFCILALESCDDPRAESICVRGKDHLVSTMEYPGLWRYYRHLPLDLDSTSLCSLVIDTHPWILLGRNLQTILSNRDEKGCFMTWVFAKDEPDVVPSFRIEADPVVNANVIAYLGDCPETKSAQEWLEALVLEDKLTNSSKWYPDEVSIYYAITRAMIRARPALAHLSPIIAERIRGLSDENGSYGNVLQTAQAVSALHDIGSLDTAEARRLFEVFSGTQREDGSWPELLAFGDQHLRWGTVGQIGHGSESVTTAFCVEAMVRLVEAVGADE